MFEMTDITVVEDLIVQQLATRPFFTDVFGMGEPAYIGRKTARMPAAAVLFERIDVEENEGIGFVKQLGSMTWAVFVIAEGIRGPRGGRMGSTGAYRGVVEACSALVGFFIGPYPMTLLSVDPEEIDDTGDAGRTIYVCRFGVQMDLIATY